MEPEPIEIQIVICLQPHACCRFFLQLDQLGLKHALVVSIGSGIALANGHVQTKGRKGEPQCVRNQQVGRGRIDGVKLGEDPCQRGNQAVADPQSQSKALQSEKDGRPGHVQTKVAQPQQDQGIFGPGRRRCLGNSRDGQSHARVQKSPDGTKQGIRGCPRRQIDLAVPSTLASSVDDKGNPRKGKCGVAQNPPNRRGDRME